MGGKLMKANKLISWRVMEEEAILPLLTNSVLIKGSHTDERDSYFSSKMSSQNPIFTIEYDISSTCLSVQGKNDSGMPSINDPEPINNAEILVDYLLETYDKNIIIDITGMDAEVLFILLKTFKNLSYSNIYAVYVQPLKYVSSRNDSNLMSIFNLSEEHSSVSSIPGFLHLYDNRPNRLTAIFLGFEGGRFQELYEHISVGENNRMYPIIPLPSFVAGWHMHVLYQNIYTLQEKGWVRELHRVTAWDPFHALYVLEKIYRDYSDEYQIFIAPFGTTPHILGCALFAILHEDINIMYDHPKVSKKRSEGIGNIRGYNLKNLF